MPIGFGCVVGSGGHSAPLLRLLHSELDAELALGGIPLEHVRRPHRRVNPAAQPHRLRHEHQVLELKECFVVGAQGVCVAQRGGVVAIEPVAPRSVRAADDLIGDLRDQADLAAEPRTPIEEGPGAESAPVIDEERPLAVLLGQEAQEDVDHLPGQVHDGQQDRGARTVGDLPIPDEVVGPAAGKIQPLLV